MSKKYVLMSYFEYEGEALRAYLEDMALRGWRLYKVGAMLLRFESIEPRRIRYDVELMKGKTNFDSVQTPDQKDYRSFCEEEGWEYIGASGLLHVFCTEREDALSIETDMQERYQRILEGTKRNRTWIVALFSFLALMNAWSCIQQFPYIGRQVFWSSNAFCVMILVTFLLFYIISFQRWKGKARKVLAETGKLYQPDWKQVRRKNHTMYEAMAVCLLGVLVGQAVRSGKGNIYVLLIYLCFYIFMMFIFSTLLGYLREKRDFSRGTNLAIYMGAAALMVVLFSAVMLCTILLVY